MLGGRTWDEWIAQYSLSHQHPINRICHTLGIPLIALSLPLFAIALFVHGFWPIPLAMFIIGWVFQFIGHYVEGKPPEFFQDWRFLFGRTPLVDRKAAGESLKDQKTKPPISQQLRNTLRR